VPADVNFFYYLPQDHLSRLDAASLVHIRPCQDAVVLGADVVETGASHHLQRVDNDERRIGMLGNEALDALLQTAADYKYVAAKVNAGRRVLHDFKQPVLDTQSAVFKAEVQRRAVDGVEAVFNFLCFVHLILLSYEIYGGFLFAASVIEF